MFYEDEFVHFKDDDACQKCNTFIAANGGAEIHEVHANFIKTAEKPMPKSPIE